MNKVVTESESKSVTAHGIFNNSVFKRNLELLLENIGPDKFRVRIPYIKGYNTREHQLESERKLKDMGVTNIQLFDYVIPKQC